MAKRSVFCIAPNRATADRLLHDLKVAEFASSAISVLFLDRKPAAAASGTAPRPAAAASSTEIRGVVAWLEGIRTVSIPGVGPLIAAGPVAVGFGPATTGGIAGGLTDFDIPDTEAARYEDRILQGEILIGVHSENPEACARARDLFGAGGAEKMFTMMEVTTPRSSLYHSRATTRATVA